MKKRKIGLMGEVLPFLKHILNPNRLGKTSVSNTGGRFSREAAQPTYRNIRAFFERRKTRTIRVICLGTHDTAPGARLNDAVRQAAAAFWSFSAAGKGLGPCGYEHSINF